MSKEERYYQTGRDTILYQSSLMSEYSGRAINLLNLGIATLVGGIIGVAPNIDSWEWNWGSIVAVSIWAVSFIGLIMASLSSTLATKWVNFPPMGGLGEITNDPNYNEDELLWFQGDYLEKAAQHNATVLNGTGARLRIALLFLANEIVLTVVIVALVLSG